MLPGAMHWKPDENHHIVKNDVTSSPPFVTLVEYSARVVAIYAALLQQSPTLLPLPSRPPGDNYETCDIGGG